MATMEMLYVPPDKRKDVVSPLLKARREAKTGEKVSFCPFGCTVEDLDDNWYCRHVVGFTLPGEGPKVGAKFEPMHVDPVREERIISPRFEITSTIGKQKDRLGNPKEIKRTMIYEEALPGDQFVQISSSYRVYRDIDKVPGPEMPEHMKEPVTVEQLVAEASAVREEVARQAKAKK